MTIIGSPRSCTSGTPDSQRSAYFNSLNEKTRIMLRAGVPSRERAEKAGVLSPKANAFSTADSRGRSSGEHSKLSRNRFRLDCILKLRRLLPLLRVGIANAAELCEIEWERIAPLFDGFRREPFNLGQETIDFFDDRETELLEEPERDYLGRLIRRKTTSSEDEEDRTFYENHRQELKSDRKLKQAWDRFVYGKPLECVDFLVGLALCLERLFGQQNISTRKRLTIRCDRATKRELRDLNVNAGLFFTRRYKDFASSLGRKSNGMSAGSLILRSLSRNGSRLRKTSIDLDHVRHCS